MTIAIAVGTGGHPVCVCVGGWVGGWVGGCVWVCVGLRVCTLIK